MTDLNTAIFAASTVEAIGTVVALLAVVAVLVYAAFNVRAGRREVGSELELAPNLKPYLNDDELETKKLDRALTAGLAGLVLVGVGLPAYWLAEPGRQEGAEEMFLSTFEGRGEELYTEGAQCNSCHGPEGVGGVASHTILDSDNEFVAQVLWEAPALNNVLLRYDRDEVYYVLEYGRPFSPMPAWGEGGGDGGRLRGKDALQRVWTRQGHVPVAAPKDADKSALPAGGDLQNHVDGRRRPRPDAQGAAGVQGRGARRHAATA